MNETLVVKNQDADGPDYGRVEVWEDDSPLKPVGVPLLVFNKIGGAVRITPCTARDLGERLIAWAERQGQVVGSSVTGTL